MAKERGTCFLFRSQSMFNKFSRAIFNQSSSCGLQVKSFQVRISKFRQSDCTYGYWYIADRHLIMLMQGESPGPKKEEIEEEQERGKKRKEEREAYANVN
jgi:hypothetical protein